MQIELLVEAIAPAIAVAETLTTGKDLRSPIFKCALIEAHEDRIVVRASSCTRSVEVTIPHKPVAVGKILVPAAQLDQIFRANKKASVRITSTERGCRVAFGRAKGFNLTTEVVEDFPDMTFFDAKHASVKVPVTALIDMCKRAHSVIHKENSKILLHGLCLHLVDGKLRVVGTNGLVLSYTTIPVEAAQEGVKYDQAVVFPDLIDLLPFVASKGTEVELQITNRAVNLRGDLGQGSSIRLIGGYPPYESALPRIAAKVIHLPRTNISSILDQLDVLTYMGVPTVQLVLENNLASWTAEGSDGRFHQEDDIVFEGDKIVMFYNPLTLAAAIKTRKAESMTFEVIGSLSPTVLRELGLPFESICVFAPLRPGNA